MPRPTVDPVSVHRAWIGLLQPDGIVASTAALVDAGLTPDPLDFGELDRLRALCGLGPSAPREREPLTDPQLTGQHVLARVFTDVLGVDAADLHGTEAQPFPADLHGLRRVLTEFNAEELAPTYALANPNRGAAHTDRPWLCLLKQIPTRWNLDRPHGDHTAAHWVASPMAKFERLLRETNVPIGVISNDVELRLVYAPAGEGAGVLTFPVAVLLGPDSDLVLGALVMLLGRARWFDGTPDGAAARDRDKAFLPHLLEESRKYQNTVSTALAEQVLDALWELLRGLQSAHVATQGALLRDWVNGHPDEIYGGLLAVLLRLVFLLYAEDREQLPAVGFYPASYGVRALYEKLREDAGRHPDTMNLRLGAWARLLATFRLVHDGGGHGAVHLPAREGSLFSPDTHPFLEGRPRHSHAQRGEALDLPAIPDGVVFQVLEKLLRVGREDLSYKTLGVEELGSVYESMMGFTVLTTEGFSLALKPDHVVVDLDALLALPGKDRAKHLADKADASVAGKSLDALRAAATVDELAEALAKSRSPRTPAVVAPGSLVLQPTAERRRSGSHYTPRTLTTPIVEKTLRPVFTALGEAPTHEQILALKVCDPAMGSGAFLVAACRWLGDRLYETWQRDGGAGKPVAVAKITPDDDERVVARRLVAQHCLYGVDKNPFAVDLARLSLWLETLAKEHPFTFLDHVLREGDSLVGVTRQQVQYLRLEPIAAGVQLPTLPVSVFDAVKNAEVSRANIRALALSDDTAEKRRLLDESEASTAFLRRVGDALVATFFAHGKDSERKKAMTALREALLADEDVDGALAVAKGMALRPFHWELEFPEVFSRENRGFDAVVGNPPFMGGTVIGTRLGVQYHHCLMALHPLHESRLGNVDLVAYFANISFDLLRAHGCFGLISTNTIAQGDTRLAGLKRIREKSGWIYGATRRYAWPGTAAVVTSIVHVSKIREIEPVLLNGEVAQKITSFLFHDGGDEAPNALEANAQRTFRGSEIRGNGFVFEPNPSDGSSSIEDMKALIAKDRRNNELILPYIGGEEFNDSPTQAPRRYVLDFREMSEAKARSWPDLFALAEERVKPMRAGNKQRNYREQWWLHSTRAPQAIQYLNQNERMLSLALVSANFAVTFIQRGTVYANTLLLILLCSNGAFACIQSRPHELWSRFFSSSMKDDFRYNASYCFETFPFPSEWESDAALDDAGRAYHEYRAQLMVANDEGLTATYNRFHSPDEDSPGILELRRLHDAMDRAVLVAYGWTDLAPTCEFLLEYEASEEEGGGRKKKPWRYRWPDALRDEVLARLLALNGKRAAEERAAAEAKAKAEAKAAGEAKAKAKADRVQGKVVEAVEATEKPKRPKRGAKAAPEGGGTPVPKE